MINIVFMVMSSFWVLHKYLDLNILFFIPHITYSMVVLSMQGCGDGYL